jgi:hypothetical protein
MLCVPYQGRSNHLVARRNHPVEVVRTTDSVRGGRNMNVRRRDDDSIETPAIPYFIHAHDQLFACAAV